MRAILALFGVAMAFLPLNSVVAMALMAQPTPGPVIGVLGGPWGIAATAVGYGAYRAYKALR